LHDAQLANTKNSYNKYLADVNFVRCARSKTGFRAFSYPYLVAFGNNNPRALEQINLEESAYFTLFNRSSVKKIQSKKEAATDLSLAFKKDYSDKVVEQPLKQVKGSEFKGIQETLTKQVQAKQISLEVSAKGDVSEETNQELTPVQEASGEIGVCTEDTDPDLFLENSIGKPNTTYQYITDLNTPTFPVWFNRRKYKRIRKRSFYF
jgi:hypothetical protein